MLVLTHQGPGFRSRLLFKEAALARAAALQADPRYCDVRAMESMRSRHEARRYFVVCHPVCEAARARMLEQFGEQRNQKAEKEGPRYVWAPDTERGLWYLLALSGEVYEVDNHAQTCTCRDFGVAKDNGLVCKHLVAFERGYGKFLSPEDWESLRLLASKILAPRDPYSPVAVLVAA